MTAWKSQGITWKKAAPRQKEPLLLLETLGHITDNDSNFSLFSSNLLLLNYMLYSGIQTSICSVCFHVFYTFVNSKGSKPSKGHISTSGFSILPPKQEKNTPRVPYIFCRLDTSIDKDGNSPRLFPTRLASQTRCGAYQQLRKSAPRFA